ncbi:MAG: NAD-dependent epimerase/dehydratase family protein [Rhodothermaceae bacterium]
MKVLVTGCAGYIGSVLTKLLLDNEYTVIGIDYLRFGEKSIEKFKNNLNFKFYKEDIRNSAEVKSIILNEKPQAVVHLAAIVGDPACAQEPEIAESINWQASKFLFDICNDIDEIKRFIFASTCSNYGKMKEEFVCEDSPLNPVSHYAKLKVKFEKYILSSKTRKDFYPTALRFATVYGISERMRFDLTVNEFVRELTLGNELVIYGEQFWRPYCHVNDLAMGCLATLNAPENKINKEVFNVGDTGENYQKKMLADELIKVIPEAKISYVKKIEDPRDYKVNFDKIKKVLNYKISRRVPDGIQEVQNMLKNGEIENPNSTIYSNS